jgi:hypothetical protein
VCGKILEISHVLERVVSIANFVRHRGLNDKQIASFLRGAKAVSKDLPIRQRKDSLMHLKLARLYI